MEGILYWLGWMTVVVFATEGAAPDIDWLDQVIGPGGLLVAMIATILGNLRGWWYSGAAYRKLDTDMREAIEKLEKDRDEWKDMALRSLSVSDTAVRRIVVEPPLEKT